MKQFIYLDNDIINSINAQKQSGLVKNRKLEDENEAKSKEEYKIETNVNGTASVGFTAIAKAETDLNLNSELGKEKNLSNTHRETIEKTAHDEAFDKAYNYICEITPNIKESIVDDYGEYIELTRVFDFVDFDYLDGLFAQNSVIDFIKKSREEEIKKQALENLNREERRAKINKNNLSVNKLINEANQEFDSIGKIINIFKKMIPYNKMLISNDGYLIPLDEKYFRVNPSTVGFMYGGNITCVGMITNIIGKDTNPNDNKNIFATLHFSVNEMLRSILPTKEENICVIHPIAIYYNKENGNEK